MAYQNNLVRVVHEASADLSSYQFRVVELDSNGKVGLAALDKGYGVLQNTPQSAEAAEVAIAGQSKGIAAAAVTTGQWLKTTSGGWLTPVNSGDAHTATFRIMGRALTTATSGSQLTFDIQKTLTIGVASGAAIA